jgi:hypothetical protein
MSSIRADDGIAIGERFIAAIERRAWDELAESFDPMVQFRALTEKGSREAASREDAARYLKRWFGDADQLILQSSEVALMQDRVRIAYRIRAHEDRWYVVEQQAYCTIRDGQIKEMDLLCSGFRPE